MWPATGLAASAAAIAKKHPSIDVLVNNAGIDLRHPSLTGDGFVTTIQVNHVAPALLSALLAPALRASPNGGRVVEVASGSAYTMLAPTFAHGLDDLNTLYGWTRNASSLGWPNFYGLSKFLQIHRASEFARREATNSGSAITAFSVNPGFFRDLPPGKPIPAGIKKTCEEMFLFKPCPQNDAQGASGIVFAALTPGIEAESGALLDYDTTLLARAPYVTQTGDSCVPRAFPVWAESAAWFDRVQSAIAPWL